MLRQVSSLRTAFLAATAGLTLSTAIAEPPRAKSNQSPHEQIPAVIDSRIKDDVVKLGGASGSMRGTDSGSLEFSHESPSGGVLPAFRLDRPIEAGFPSINVPFGLEVHSAGMTEEELKRLSALKNLTYLALKGTRGGVKLDSLRSALSLTALDLSGSSISDADIETLTQLKELSLLDLSGCSITDAGADALGGVLPPGSIDFGKASSVNLGLADLTRLRSLYGLSLPTSVADDWLAEVKRLPKLGALRLSFSHVTVAGLKHVARMDNLKALDLSNTKITNAGLRELRELPALVSLHLGHTAVTDAGLKELRNLPALTELCLSGCQISEAGLQELQHLPTLTTLRLNGCKVTKAGLQSLQNLPRLRTLDLSYTDVTDEALKGLRPLGALTELDLTYTDVGDDVESDLGTLKALTRLTLNDTYLSVEGLAAVREALPSCRVVGRRVLR